MLKKKLQTLVTEKNLSVQKHFEVVSDSSAAEILGGVQDCPKLQTCGQFSGNCPNLTLCERFS